MDKNRKHADQGRGAENENLRQTIYRDIKIECKILSTRNSAMISKVKNCPEIYALRALSQRLAGAKRFVRFDGFVRPCHSDSI